MKITSLEQLKKESSQGNDFFILLNGGLKSSKWIKWDDEEETFLVTHYIDGTDEELTAEELMNPEHTNISEAMSKGALFKDL